MNKLFFCFFLLIISHLLFAGSDQVFLKNGQVIIGIVQNYEIGKFVEIVTTDNRRQIINWDQIESLNLASVEEPVQSPAKSGQTDFKLDYSPKKGFGFEQTLDSDQLRLNWQSQGGTIRSTEYTMNVILTKMDFSDSLNNDMRLKGFGVGYTANFNLLKFSPPNFADKKYYSYAAKLGLSLSLSANAFETKSEQEFVDELPGIYYSSTDVEISSDINIAMLEAGLNLGVNIGLGHFLNPQKWGGIILGIAWRPTWQWTNTVTNTITDIWYEYEVFVPYNQYFWDWQYTQDKTTESNSQFSWSSVEFTLDIGGIKAMTDKMAKRANFRLNCLIVPPVGDYKLSMLYLGMGIVWYR